MLYIALGCVLLGLMLGGAGMRRVGRMAGRAWRPGAGLLALAAFVGAAILGMTDRFAAAAALSVIGLGLALGVRRPAPKGGVPPSAPPPSPDIAAAASILGVAPDASNEEVQAAYLRLIRRVHPDAGGAAGLAAQLNAARDRMLRR